jgi:hypothetical protein
LLLSLINRYTSYNMCTCTWQTQAMATQRRWGRRSLAEPYGGLHDVDQLADLVAALWHGDHVTQPHLRQARHHGGHVGGPLRSGDGAGLFPLTFWPAV